MADGEFIIRNGKGFQVQYPNGLTVSVQFGDMHYCNNRNFLTPAPKSERDHVCGNAEVAVLGRRGQFVRGWPHCSDDDVQGYLTPAQVHKIMCWAIAQP